MNQSWSFNVHIYTFDHQSIDKTKWTFILFTFVSNTLQQSNYSSMFIQNNHLYDLLIIKRPNYDHIIKLSNQKRPLRITCTLSVANKSINWINLSLFLHPFWILSSNQTKFNPLYRMIFYMIHWLSSDQPFIIFER